MTHDGVSDPVCRSTECHSQVTPRKWVNFGANNPNDRAGANRETDYENEQPRDGDVAKLGMLFDPNVKERSHSNHGEAHGDKTCIHDRFSTEFVDKGDGDEGRKHVGYSDDYRSPHLLIRGCESRNAKNRRREIHHDIDAGKLLNDL